MRWLLVLVLSATCFAQQPERVVTPGFVALNAAAFGAAALDVAMTRHCIDSNACHETNPIMKGGAGRMYALSFAVQGLGTFVSYKLKQSGSRTWVIAPIVGIGVHSYGAGIALRWK